MLLTVSAVWSAGGSCYDAPATTDTGQELSIKVNAFLPCVAFSNNFLFLIIIELHHFLPPPFHPTHMTHPLLFHQAILSQQRKWNLEYHPSGLETTLRAASWFTLTQWTPETPVPTLGINWCEMETNFIIYPSPQLWGNADNKSTSAEQIRARLELLLSIVWAWTAARKVLEFHEGWSQENQHKYKAWLCCKEKIKDRRESRSVFCLLSSSRWRTLVIR